MPQTAGRKSRASYDEDPKWSNWRAVEDEQAYQTARRGWHFGEDAFRKELIEQIAEEGGQYHCAQKRQRSRRTGSWRM
jgi:hypothetical protein